MEEVLLIFGICAVVVVDDGRNFKCIFKETCEHLKLTYWCIYGGNHKGNGAKKYHCFLNKTQTITGTDSEKLKNPKMAESISKRN